MTIVFIFVWSAILNFPRLDLCQTDKMLPLQPAPACLWVSPTRFSRTDLFYWQIISNWLQKSSQSCIKKTNPRSAKTTFLDFRRGNVMLCLLWWKTIEVLRKIRKLYGDLIIAKQKCRTKGFLFLTRVSAHLNLPLNASLSGYIYNIYYYYMYKVTGAWIW